MTSRVLSKLRGKLLSLEFIQICHPNKNCYSQQPAVKPNNPPHLPVMANEVLKYIELPPGGTMIDMTFGAGGHSRKILESNPDVKIFALDRDPVAHEFAQKLALEYPGQVIPLLGKFSELPALLKEQKVPGGSIDAFLFDFGCSSMQFDTAMRGFSISKNGPLDMRMDGFRCPNQPTAADVLASLREEDLARIFKTYADEHQGKKIARAIVEARFTLQRLETTHELAAVINSALNGESGTDMLDRPQHNATKTFQALRIFVNDELNEINYAMFIAEAYLKVGGRLLTISFHSLEDLIVKRHISGNFKGEQINVLPLKLSSYNATFSESEINDHSKTAWKMLHPHVLVPKPDEVENNKRSRSAKFRAIVKIK